MNCLNCGKEVIQVEGKQERQTCDDKCRQAYYRKCKQPVTKPTCDKQPVTSDDLTIVDGGKSYVIKGGSLRVPERDKKGVLTGNEVYALSADAVASELASEKIASYPRDGLDLGMEVW